MLKELAVPFFVLSLSAFGCGSSATPAGTADAAGTLDSGAAGAGGGTAGTAGASDSGAAGAGGTAGTGLASDGGAVEAGGGPAGAADAGAVTACGAADMDVGATVNGTRNCYAQGGARMELNSPFKLTTFFASTPDSLSKTLTFTFPGPDVGVFQCGSGSAPVMMVYREVGANGHTGNAATSCTIEVTEVGTGSPVIIKGKFSGVLPYTDGAPPAGNWNITEGHFSVVRTAK
jgi:hypothetical protein